jgi:hypothetical protein
MLEQIPLSPRAETLNQRRRAQRDLHEPHATSPKQNRILDRDELHGTMMVIAGGEKDSKWRRLAPAWLVLQCMQSLRSSSLG